METKKYDLEPEERVVKTESYKDEIYLSVKIGNGQIGGNKVTSNGKILANGNLTEPIHIGNAKTLNDNVIEIETNVLDVNAFTNRCVITTSFLNQNNKELFSIIDNGDAPENGVASFKGRYLVKFVMIFILFFSFFNHRALVQTASNNLDFKNLETAASPGLILFDKAPSAIEKPTTPQGLGVSLLGLGINGGALEFAPYWLKDHPNLTAEEMYNNKTPILSHFAISFATINSDTLSYISGGLKTRIFQSYGNNVSKLDEIKTQIEDALSKAELEKVDSLRIQYVGITENPIYNIDIAAAIGASSLSNSYANLDLNRWAIWMSFNFRPKGDDFYCTAVARFISNKKYDGTDTQVSLVDLGTRFNYDVSNFTLSLEYVNRMNLTLDIFNDYRLAVIGSYKLTDNIFITSTFGKNFTEVNNIIALAGINFGFSKNKIKAF